MGYSGDTSAISLGTHSGFSESTCQMDSDFGMVVVEVAELAFVDLLLMLAKVGSSIDFILERTANSTNGDLSFFFVRFYKRG